MIRKIVRTADGSHTLQIPEWQEQYHSMHGALQESEHVFINQGLAICTGNPVRILEMGFGTGLNALLTCLDALKRGLAVEYTALEAFPLQDAEWQKLNYPSLLDHPKAQSVMEAIHTTPWGSFHSVNETFKFRKVEVDFRDFRAQAAFDLIYFDAFGARVQPELWTDPMFVRMYEAAAPGGILVTYAAKGSVRRAMEAAGFKVERLPGPPGKREMLRARRPGTDEC